MSSAIPLLDGVSAIADRYDGFILDIWGVLHDGAAPYPDVVEALRRLIAAGKRVVVLSNAPVRAETVIGRITRIGIPRDGYHAAMTSGEEVYRLLVSRDDPFYAGLGRHCLHIGPARDKGMLDVVDLIETRDPAEASFILNTGVDGDDETVDTYEPLLQALRARDVPMICANADLHVMQGDRMVICAGALAQRYEAMGGRARWHGKPNRSVYETCFGLLGVADRRRILGVGDSLRTDIAGARGAGIDSLLVAGGIHAEEFGFKPGNPFAPDEARAPLNGAIRPDYVIGRLRW
jgi:HAD superfamily hydrolase (TIGR01459 family)